MHLQPIGILVIAGGTALIAFLPLFGLLLSPMIAAAAMVASSISVVLNVYQLPAADGVSSDGAGNHLPPTSQWGNRTIPAPPMAREVDAVAPAGRKLVTYPVCGMQIDPEHAAGTSEYNGEVMAFCSPGCKQQFDRESERCVKAEPQ